ncbi:MAG: hypothetical protein K5790_10240 [Nitrosopumilus sp.]|uniref:hypothetical protein n=1 Tax=Nitrosopumilus sp. TaxID=2024843 RepID=UPI00247BB867|nr:hypothetical protein [Nitrosopumilus sp.]MCV0393648.1 hypothetical protein [Nitrosopumilus sp.]
MPNEDSNSVDVTTNLLDSSDTDSGVEGIQKAKPTKKNYNKIIKILALITLIPITSLILDYYFNPQPVVTETVFTLTDNCWINVNLVTQTAEIVRLEFDCNKEATVDEVRDAMKLLKEKATELNYNIKIPFTAEGLHAQFQREVETEGSI